MRKVNIEFIKMFLIFVGSINGHPSGHLQPLGSHLPPMLNITTLKRFPFPLDFYEEFVKKGTPVLFQKVLETVNMPAYHKWTDDYLAKHYGNIKIDVEPNKKEDRKNWKGTQQKLSDFLKMYKDKEMYLIQNLKVEMENDMAIPSCLRCGGFQKVIQAVVMWFSSGGTKSQLHHDNLDNINCLLDGKKDLFMIDKKYADLVEADGWNSEGTFSDVDVDAVDMYKFPNLKDIPWYQVNLSKGDCFYIPYKWYHHVYSHPGRNFAVNVWFNHLWWFNITDCNGADPKLSSVIPYRKFTKAQEIEDLKQDILKPFIGNELVSRELFSEIFQESVYSDTIFDNLDQNFDGHLSWEEMYMIDEDMLTVLTNFNDLHETNDDDVVTGGQEINENIEIFKENISSEKQSIASKKSESNVIKEQKDTDDITNPKINDEKSEL